MRETDASQLLDLTLEGPAKVTRVRAVFPFFDRELKTRFLLVFPAEGKALHTRDLPTGRVSRVLAYPDDPRLRRLDKVRFHRLWHFDPWWLMRDGKGLPAQLRKTVLARNLAGKQLPQGVIENFWYDDGLKAVTSGRIGGKRLPLRQLLPLLVAGPIEPVPAG